MRKASPLLLTLVCLFALSAYGCTNQKSGAFSAKIREMETRYAKLEEDYKAIVVTAEATRKKVAQLEAQKAELAKQVEEVRVTVNERTQERDDLKKQLSTRTGERDSVQTQLTQFRDDLQKLLGRVDSAVNAMPGGNGVILATPASRSSQ